MFMATFFNTAFCHEILEALRGGEVSVMGGLKFAAGKSVSILLWSVLAGIVGYLIQQLEQRLSFVGKILVRIVGVAWSVAAVFAIPVLIEKETTNPLEILRDSAQTLRKTWGETLAGYVGLQAAGFLIVLMSVMFLIAGMWAAAQTHSGAFIVGVAGAWLVGTFGMLYVAGVAGQVFRCALYLFASTGNVPDGYDRDAMDAAWRVKKD
jgi:hypothetical protein